MLTRSTLKGQQKVRKAAFADSECGEKLAAKANYDFADPECGEKSAAKVNYDFADLKWDKKSAKRKCRCIC